MKPTPPLSGALDKNAALTSSQQYRRVAAKHAVTVSVAQRLLGDNSGGSGTTASPASEADLYSVGELQRPCSCCRLCPLTYCCAGQPMVACSSAKRRTTALTGAKTRREVWRQHQPLPRPPCADACGRAAAHLVVAAGGSGSTAAELRS